MNVSIIAILLATIPIATSGTILEDGCKVYEFQCGNGKCINWHYVCDEENDCGDFSDEEMCGTYNHGTSSRFFICNNGQRVNILDRCDNITDCIDGSDEHNCPLRKCSALHYRCNNGKCIFGHKIDNGTNDMCGDKSDKDFRLMLKKTGKYSAFSFKCRSNNTYIHGLGQCDGLNFCNDSSDEENCKNVNHCTRQKFKCNNNICVLVLSVCNGKDDCGDNSDERNCKAPSCLSNEHLCGDGQCVKEEAVCDGRRHCVDGSDEWNCSSPEPSCPPCFFQCGNGRCIPMTKRCNGLLECADSSDEWQCGNFAFFHHCSPENLLSLLKYKQECATCEYKCGNEECIPLIKKCDNVFDCRDQSDETECGNFTLPLYCNPINQHQEFKVKLQNQAKTIDEINGKVFVFFMAFFVILIMFIGLMFSILIILRKYKKNADHENITNTINQNTAKRYTRSTDSMDTSFSQQTDHQYDSLNFK